MNTLLIGNTGYWNEETLKYAFPEDSIVLCGTDCEDKKSGSIKWFRLEPESKRFRRVFDTYSFDRVIYMSEYLTYHAAAENELENIRNLLRLCRGADISQLIYFTSDVVCSIEENSKRRILEAAEGLFEYHRKLSGVDLRIIRSPFLISGTKKNDYLYGLFHGINRGKTEIRIKAPEKEHNHFIDMRDIADFFYRLQDDREKGDRIIRLFPLGEKTFRDLGNFLMELNPDILVEFADSSAARPFYSEEENKVRTAFGWYPKYDPISYLSDYYKEYLSLHEEKPSFRERVREFVHMNSGAMVVLEMIIGALLVEYMNRISGNSVQFRMIDYRLLYVVIFSTIYGTNLGFMASVIESVSIIMAYKERGTNWLMIFYDPGNWMPFILMFVVAAVCGYVKQKKDEDERFVRDENAALKEQFRFVSRLYEEALDYKNIYKRDLIGSRDGFGRIFEVVKRLNNTVPEKIFTEAIPVMEDVLENDSIAVYSINDSKSGFARLEVCSPGMSSTMKKSLDLKGYDRILETVKKGDVWFNSDMTYGLPMYVAGIVSQGELSVIIMIYRAGFGQTNNYYLNLIRILSGLMENFMVKAWEYRRAIEERIYIEGTNLAKWDYFKEQLKIGREAAANRLNSFRLFRIDSEGRSPEEIYSLLKNKMRTNDLMGQHPDGSVYIMTAQVDESSEQIVLNRLLETGIKCEMTDPAVIE